MKKLIEVEDELTVARLIEALERVDNKDLPVNVWRDEGAWNLSITDLEYEDDALTDERGVWINVGRRYKFFGESLQ